MSKVKTKKKLIDYCKKLKEDKIFKILTALIFIVLVFILGYYHEPWRDEAQSWLLARDLNIIDLFKQLKYEGHPIMWFLVLKFFIKIGLSYKYIFIIPWIITSISVVIFLKISPFNKFTNLLIVLSPPFIYYFGVLARSYSLVLLEMVLLMLIYKNRDKHPIIYGLLLFSILNTHILMAGFVGALSLIDFYETIKEKDKKIKIKKIITLFIVFIGCLFLFLQLYKSLGIYTNNGNNSVIHKLPNLLLYFSATFKYLTNNFLFYLIMIICFILIVYFLIKSKKFKSVFIILVSLIYQVFLFTFIYPMSYYMTSLPFIIILFIISHTLPFLKENKYILNIVISIFFISMLPLSIQISKNVVKEKFSYAQSVAEYINKNIPKKSELYCFQTPYCSSIIPYLKKDYKFVFINDNKTFTYTTWFKNYYVNLDYSKFYDSNIKYYVGLKNENISYFENLIKEGKAEYIYEDKNLSKYSEESYYIIRVNK